MLETLVAAGAATVLPGRAFTQPATPKLDWGEAILAWMESLSRPDGGYAWADQQDSHLTPTFAVIGCYNLLKATPPNKDRLAAFVRGHNPGRLKRLEQEHRLFLFQQVQSLAWLGESASDFSQQVLSWQRPVAYLKQYERHGYPVFESEIAAFTCRQLLGLPLDGLSPHFTAYLDARRRPNGSFKNTPASEGGDGHVLNTWCGVEALRILGRADERRSETTAWLRGCQLPNGGFTWQPKAPFAGVDDAAYTWAAVRALRELGSVPLNRDLAVAYLRSLWNADGGFSDRPGWESNPVAAYYALDGLSALDALGPASPPRRPKLIPRSALPANLKIFTIQIEAHGQGSPAEAVDLAAALRIHLWGAKNAKPGWIARAQQLAGQEHVPVTFFVANEEYGTWVDVPGLGTYSHTSDVIAAPATDFGPSLANARTVSWPEFRQRRLAPLQQAGGRLIWQFGENEALVRLFLDDSIERGGYAAISTFHFGNPDFTNTEPFLNRYRGRIPFIALQDAHGSEPWWFADMTTGFRTIFLAREPSWEGWLEALRENRVAAVRHDAVSSFKTWLHAGSDEVLDFVRQRESVWRWWNNPAIQRPLVSIVPVTLEDEFEAARPENGLMIRVRCAWENTAQGAPRKPITELVSLAVDREKVEPVLVETRKQNGSALTDHYHQFHLPHPAPGRHVVTAVVRVIDTGKESSRTREFVL